MVRLRHLVDASWLSARLGDADLRVFDCTTKLEAASPEALAPYSILSGQTDYESGHIPGAGFLDIQAELSDSSSPLPFTAPCAEEFAEAMSRNGVGEGTFVVLYSAGTPAWATRVWWLLRLFGFDEAAVLDGGWEGWKLARHPVSRAPAAYPPAHFIPRARPELVASKDDVLAALDAQSHLLVNTLSDELFRGETSSRYGRPGRIPTSMSLPYGSLLDADAAAFLSATECDSVVTDALGADDVPVMTYCGSGITASLVDFVLAGLGRDRTRLYDGSLSEWAPDPSLPLERG